MTGKIGSFESVLDVKTTELPEKDGDNKPVPSDEALFEKLREIFGGETSAESNGKFEQSNLENNLLEGKDDREITLPDGTVIDLPIPSGTVEHGVDKLPIQNKQDGLRRENEVEAELNVKYPPEKGYSIEQEVYLRDKNGNIVKDPLSGEARRIDFVVVKDGRVVDSIEVTSKTADKTEQCAKESRIREEGGNYIKDGNGTLIEIPPTVQTRIERRN